MFTGIIEDIGTVREIRRGSQNKIRILTSLPGIKKGDSISINGVCLTVTDIKKAVFSADISVETLSVTNLGKLKTGERVNLERALPADGRFGGHIVTGHVETTAKIIKILKKPGFNIFTFEAAARQAESGAIPFVNKGSIALDGISLTAIDVMHKNAKKAATRFSAAIIPFTLNNTALKFKKPGDTVNLEPDIMAKYIQPAANKKKESKITLEYLKKSGF